MEQGVSDTVVSFVDNDEMVEAVLIEQDSIPTVNNSNQISKKKTVNKVTPVTQPEGTQTLVADIWTDEQINFLNKVEKILVFHVRITDIGSRKLELDSQLGQTDIKAFVKVLLDPNSYPETALIQSKKGSAFEPSYQMLLEASNEKLTVLFDTKNMEMVVASLFDRKRYKITPAFVDFVLKIAMKN